MFLDIFSCLDNICNNLKFEMYDKFLTDLVSDEIMGWDFLLKCQTAKLSSSQFLKVWNIEKAFKY